MLAFTSRYRHTTYLRHNLPACLRRSTVPAPGRVYVLSTWLNEPSRLKVLIIRARDHGHGVKEEKIKQQMLVSEPWAGNGVVSVASAGR